MSKLPSSMVGFMVSPYPIYVGRLRSSKGPLRELKPLTFYQIGPQLLHPLHSFIIISWRSLIYLNFPKKEEKKNNTITDRSVLDIGSNVKFIREFIDPDSWLFFHCLSNPRLYRLHQLPNVSISSSSALSWKHPQKNFVQTVASNHNHIELRFCKQTLIASVISCMS